MTLFPDWASPIAPGTDIELRAADERNARKRWIASLEIPFDGSTPASVMNAEPASQYQDSKDAASYPTDYM